MPGRASAKTGPLRIKRIAPPVTDLRLGGIGTPDNRFVHGIAPVLPRQPRPPDYLQGRTIFSKMEILNEKKGGFTAQKG
jgi:hypothetical protein